MFYLFINRTLRLQVSAILTAPFSLPVQRVVKEPKVSLGSRLEAVLAPKTTSSLLAYDSSAVFCYQLGSTRNESFPKTQHMLLLYVVSVQISDL